MLSIRNLHMVVALDRYRSFSRAAAALGVSQPSLTRSLKGLEDSLSVQLFDRHRAGPTVPDSHQRQQTEPEKRYGLVEQEQKRFRPRILVESFSAARRIVLAGTAISACIPFQIRRELAAQELVLLPIRLPSLRLNYGLISRPGRPPSPAMSAFASIVRSLEEDLLQQPVPEPCIAVP
jgi:DNA-binding transcriptional LysR family regulator